MFHSLLWGLEATNAKSTRLRSLAKSFSDVRIAAAHARLIESLDPDGLRVEILTRSATREEQFESSHDPSFAEYFEPARGSDVGCQPASRVGTTEGTLSVPDCSKHY